MQDSGSQLGYGASFPDSDGERHTQGHPGHRQVAPARQPGRRRASEPEGPAEGSLLPDTPTRAVRPPKPAASRTPEPTDTPPPGYGPRDIRPATSFGWPSNLSGASDSTSAAPSWPGNSPGFAEPGWSDHSNLYSSPSPMDEPLIPELPEVPFFPGTEPPAGPHGDWGGGNVGYAEDFGPDPLGAPYPGPARDPAGQPIPATGYTSRTDTYLSGAGTLPAPAAPGAATYGAGTRDRRSDQPVLPFVETTGFFQRPAEFREASPDDGLGQAGEIGASGAARRELDPPAVTTGTHARIDANARSRRLRQPRQTRASGGGLPGWAAITLSLVCTGAAILADLALTSSIGVLFGLCFVLTSFGVAAGVRRTAMFTAGVLPPLAALAAFVVLAVAAPERFVEPDGVLGIGTAILAGLAASAWFLVAAWAVALGTLALRTARQPARQERPAAA